MVADLGEKVIARDAIHGRTGERAGTDEGSGGITHDGHGAAGGSADGGTAEAGDGAGDDTAGAGGELRRIFPRRGFGGSAGGGRGLGLARL